MSKVSVVMPCYQNARTLAQTVQSIRSQSFEDWELIAIDDGSSDGTGELLDAFAAEEGRMRVIHQPNAGVSAARNAGMDAASGEWLCFVDADDYIEPHALQTMLALTDEMTDIACCAYVMRFIDEGDRQEKHVCADGDLICVLESLIRGDSALNSMCARLYRRSMIEEKRLRAPLGVKVGEDVLFNLEAFRAARAWRMSEETVYVYEFGGDSAMTRAKQDRYQRSRQMLEGIGAFIRREGMQTQLFRAHIDVYIRTLRADRGRLRAALAFDRAMVQSIENGVCVAQLPPKQKLYYCSLRLLPSMSYFLP